MKKITLIFIATILLCFFCEKTMAQAPYKASVGGMLPYASTAVGPSSKFFISDKVALQTDILTHETITGFIEENHVWICLYLSIEQNTNVMYQKKIKDKKNSELFWFIGGGATLGCELLPETNGKFGVNAITGFECVFKNKPLSIQIDLRPGYAMLFNFDENLNMHNIWFSPPSKNPWSHFDWLIGFTLRRTFNKKVE